MATGFPISLKKNIRKILIGCLLLSIQLRSLEGKKPNEDGILLDCSENVDGGLWLGGWRESSEARVDLL